GSRGPRQGDRRLRGGARDERLRGTPDQARKRDGTMKSGTSHRTRGREQGDANRRLQKRAAIVSRLFFTLYNEKAYQNVWRRKQPAGSACDGGPNERECLVERYTERAARRPGVWPPTDASASSRAPGGFNAAATASSTRSSHTKRTCARAASGTS